jgi:protein-S-isoprenylcysteine O-methyltransferase Ste14
MVSINPLELTLQSRRFARLRELIKGIKLENCNVSRNPPMKNVRAIVSSTILTIAAVGQIILSFVLYKDDGISAVRITGWIILWISAVFGWLPIHTLKKWGKPGGRGYVRTTVLVDRGVYAIVRHPQYLAGILMGLALPLIAQHWIVAMLGAIVIFIDYMDTFAEEKDNVKKFGEKYERYRESVPRVNFFVGLIRLLCHRRERHRHRDTPNRSRL